MLYEIKVYESWVKVSEWIFRSWGGPRRLNGKRYRGPVYYLGTENFTKKPPAPSVRR
jgi:hypothetical protein